MANFIFPNYSEQEIEEFDNKILLIPKEKYTQQMIKFSEYNPTLDTYKFICSISYNDSKVYRVIYDDIEISNYLINLEYFSGIQYLSNIF